MDYLPFTYRPMRIEVCWYCVNMAYRMIPADDTYEHPSDCMRLPPEEIRAIRSGFKHAEPLLSDVQHDLLWGSTKRPAPPGEGETGRGAAASEPGAQTARLA